MDRAVLPGFFDGTFGGGGANTYVSAKGRIQTVNHWDGEWRSITHNEQSAYRL